MNNNIEQNFCTQNVPIRNCKALETRCLCRFQSFCVLLIFHRSWWFWGVVEEDAVDAWYFGNDTVYQVVDQVVGEVFDCYFHNICGVDGTDDAWPVKCSLTVFYAC